MAATVATVAYLGLEARAVEVQVQLSSGLPRFTIVGLPDKAVAESRERVRAALASIGLALPPRVITVNLSGTSSDNVGVIQVTWATDRGGSGTAVGTASWTANGISIQPGSTVVTVTAHDAAGNVTSSALAVTYAPSDLVPPVISITGPTPNSTFSTSDSNISLRPRIHWVA